MRRTKAAKARQTIASKKVNYKDDFKENPENYESYSKEMMQLNVPIDIALEEYQKKRAEEDKEFFKMLGENKTNNVCDNASSKVDNEIEIFLSSAYGVEEYCSI